MGDCMGNIFRENAAKVGQLIAEEVSASSFPLTSGQVWDVVARYHVQVRIVPAGDQYANPKVRAIYDRCQKLILVEENSLLSLKLLCEARGLGPLNRSDILAMHIAHELFHHLEEIGQVPLTMYYGENAGVRKRRFTFLTEQPIFHFCTGPPLAILREIAAHSFVKTLLGLAFSPEKLENETLQEEMVGT